MRASPELIDYLKRREGFRATPYLDSAGHWTIGYGHKIRPHEKTTLTRLTKAEASGLLVRDCDPFELYLDAVSGRFAQPINQHQFDALVSLVFNIGLKAFETSTLLRRLREGDLANSPAEFDRWIYVTKKAPDGRTFKQRDHGLINRRRMDRAIFERGEYAV